MEDKRKLLRFICGKCTNCPANCQKRLRLTVGLDQTLGSEPESFVAGSQDKREPTAPTRHRRRGIPAPTLRPKWTKNRKLK